MNARKCIVNGVLVVATLLSLGISTGFNKAVKVDGSSYSACTNPGQFWHVGFGVDLKEYENIYLHVCARVGDAGENSEENNNSSDNNNPVSTPIPPSVSTPIVPVEFPTSNPKPENTPTPAPTQNPTQEPANDCKNKNQFKDGTVDCNAGGGNG